MYDALIIAHGEIPPLKFWQHLPYRTLICTDGAALTIEELKLTPNIIIGDLDSITHEHAAQLPEIAKVALEQRFSHSQIIWVADQNSTDFEKALLLAQERQWGNVLCLGALGKSADHSLHNLLLLAQYHSSLRLMLLHVFENQCQWIFPLEPQTRIHTQPGQKLSFFPIPEATLSTHGLQWELKDTRLTQMGVHAVRNTTIAQVIDVECAGKCLCFLITPYPVQIR